MCSGDWSRVCGPSVTRLIAHGSIPCAVFLDPPYSHEIREATLYRKDNDCGAAVREWAIENGSNPLLRIALCGYEGEHEMPGWSKHAWKTQGGYGGQAEERNGNEKKERIWFSPHCLGTRQGSLFG